MTATDSQLDLFAPKPAEVFYVYRDGAEYARPEPVTDREEVIDAYLHSVAQQSNLRALLAGEKWREVGCGSTDPHGWQADAKGITLRWMTDRAELIPPAEIMARVRQYVPVADLEIVES